MSSLLQFRGQVQRKGVGLEMYLTRRVFGTVPSLPDYYVDQSTEFVVCPQCDREHEQLYRVWRKPVGTFGCWVVFCYNGEEHVPDLSCPFGVDKLPRGAERLSPEDNAIAWHKA